MNETHLIPSHPGNLNAAKSGVFSSRVMAPRAREVADELMTLDHVRPLTGSLPTRSGH